MLRFCTLLAGILVLACVSLFAQPDPNDIQIARDSLGVPHIYAPTDAGVAYGLAWAHAEDDFATIQQQLLIVRSRSAEVLGKESAPADLVVAMLGLRDLVTAEKYQTQLSPAFRQVLEGYCAGLNRYAAMHPEEVELKGLFPVTGRDLVAGYLLGLGLLTNTANVVGSLLDGSIAEQDLPVSTGSNAIAVAPHRTEGGGTFLAINSHQPLEGLFSWYEAHLISEEGTNVLGATFPGGASIFLGANAHLGWAHTVNHADFNDVYQLRLNEAGDAYRFGEQWLPLQRQKAKIKVRLWGFLKVPVTRSYYPTRFGPAFRNDSGVFALSFAARHAIRASEQWWRMNKARNLAEFQAALRMQGITGTNIIYADREGNILYLGNASVPPRDPAVDWQEVLPGDSTLLWGEDLVPIEQQALYLNPESGYLFNTNNTPFHATAEGYNLDPEAVSASLGYRGGDNNRSMRLAHLLAMEDTLSWATFKRIKYDRCYPEPLHAFAVANLELLLQLDPTQHPELAEAIALLNQWDRCTQVQSQAAGLFVLSTNFLYQQLGAAGRMIEGERIRLTEEEALAAIGRAQAHLVEHFGQIDVPWGTVQRHRRGEVDLPVGGGPDILAASYGAILPDGRIRVTHGDTYIQLVRWNAEGQVYLESINAYGASARPGSAHHTDQMPLYVEQRTRNMTLDWETVRAQAVRVYQPGQ